jgi:hypothetical protein
LRTHIEAALSLAAARFMSEAVPRQTDPAKLDLCRTRAQECERMAAEASDPETRLLLRAAEEWRFLYGQHVADLH